MGLRNDQIPFRIFIDSIKITPKQKNELVDSVILLSIFLNRICDLDSIGLVLGTTFTLLEIFLLVLRSFESTFHIIFRYFFTAN